MGIDLSWTMSELRMGLRPTYMHENDPAHGPFSTELPVIRAFDAADPQCPSYAWIVSIHPYG